MGVSLVKRHVHLKKNNNFWCFTDFGSEGLTSDEFPTPKTQAGGTTIPIRRGSGYKSEVGWIGMMSLYWPRNLSSTLLENWQLCCYLNTLCNASYMLPATFHTLRRGKEGVSIFKCFCGGAVASTLLDKFDESSHLRAKIQNSSNELLPFDANLGKIIPCQNRKLSNLPTRMTMKKHRKLYSRPLLGHLRSDF